MSTLLRKFAIKLRYPKLLLLAMSLFLGYLIYTDENNFQFHALIGHLGMFGVFCSGLLFSHGFTAGPAIASLLIVGDTQPFFLSGVIATVGMHAGNLLVYQKLRISYEEEFESISSHPFFRMTVRFLGKITPQFIRSYLLPAFAGILTATPLPDEFSAALVHASKNMSVKIFITVSFIFSAFGVFFILAIGKFL